MSQYKKSVGERVAISLAVGVASYIALNVIANTAIAVTNVISEKLHKRKIRKAIKKELEDLIIKEQVREAYQTAEVVTGIPANEFTKTVN